MPPLSPPHPPPTLHVGFFEFVVIPLFHNFSSVFKPARAMMDAVLHNYTHWKAADAQAKQEAHIKAAQDKMAASEGK
jgi:hypothetical protein